MSKLLLTTITLENMEFYAFHGCYTEEQRVGNRFRVDLTVDYNAHLAAQTDDVANALNYLALYEIVRREMRIKSHILENVALRTLKALFENFSALETAEIRISKLAPPLGGQLQGVSVTMKMNSQDC